MTLFLIFLALSSFSPAVSCPLGELSVVEPQTQKVVCLNKWKANTLVVVTEKDCGPCSELLDRIRLTAEKNPRKIELVWVETDLNSCLSSALKMASFASSWCSSRTELKNQWQVESTPIVFWEQNNRRRTQTGSVEKNRSLPWNATDSGS